MKLLSWKPYVTGAGSAIEVYFGVKALLECPVCKKRRKVTTSVHNIDSGPNNLIFWSVGALVRVDDPEEGNGPVRAVASCRPYQRQIPSDWLRRWG